MFPFLFPYKKKQEDFLQQLAFKKYEISKNVLHSLQQIEMHSSKNELNC